MLSKLKEQEVKALKKAARKEIKYDNDDEDEDDEDYEDDDESEQEEGNNEMEDVVAGSD